MMRPEITKQKFGQLRMEIIQQIDVLCDGYIEIDSNEQS